MVDYIRHGTTVTVAPSKGQTGGSGFGSEGTYSSDQAARSAVSSGTREGAIKDEQLEAKRKALQSPTAQWSSQSAYEEAYRSYLQAGGSPISQPAGVIPGSTMEERRAEAAAYNARQGSPQAHIQQAQSTMLKNPLTGEMFQARPDPYAGVQGIPGAEWLAKTREGKVPQRIDEPYRTGYQWVAAPKRELSQTEKVAFEVLPKGMGMSAFSANFAKQATNIANSIRGINTDFVNDPLGQLPRLGKESVARTVEFGGIIPGTAEIVGKTAITKPAALPMMAVVGGVFVVGGIAKQVETEPAQLVSDIVVTGAIFHGVGKVRTKATEVVKFTGKEFVPPKMIIDPQAFKGVDYPVVPKGATPADMIAEFKKGEFRLPGTEGKTGGWHATPSEWAKETVTTPGSSELPGTYIAPATVPHYWQINRGFKMFGWDAPPKTPAGIWLETSDIRRSPPATRYSLAAQARFLKEPAPKDVAYISSTFEKGMKMEKEAIIPPEAIAKRVRFEQYTEWEGKKVPLMEYTVKQDPYRDILGNLPKTEQPKVRKAIAMGMAVPMGLGSSKPSGAQKEPDLPFREFERQQRMISRQYREYKTPVFTPESLVTSLSRSASRSLRSGTPSSVRSSIGSSRSVSQAVSRQISSVTSSLRGSSGIPIGSSPPGYPRVSRGSSGIPRVPIGSSPPPSIPGRPPPGIPYTPPPTFIFPRLPKFDNMGATRKLKGRKASAYEIINPFATLKDIVGKY